MNVKIGAKIKSLRKRDDITQERLAEVLGVTSQAISKWESEISYPDIEYITPIANFFNVTIDNLFDYDTAEKRRKVDEYCEQYDALQKDCTRNPAQERVDMMRQALAEFPAEENLLFRLGKALYYKWCEYWWHEMIDKNVNSEGYWIYDYEKFKSFDSWKEAVAILEELLTTSVDDSIRSQCRPILANIYARTGEKDKVLAIAEKSDPISRSKQSILADTLDGKDGMMYRQEELVIFLRSFQGWVGHISRVFIRDANVIIEAHDIIISLYKFIFSDGNFGAYNADLSEWYSIYAYELLKQDKFDESFEALENSYSHAKMLGELQDKYTAPFVNLIKINADKNLAKNTLQGLLQMLKGEADFFKKIYSDPRYVELISRIEADITKTN